MDFDFEKPYDSVQSDSAQAEHEQDEDYKQQVIEEDEDTFN